MVCTSLYKVLLETWLLRSFFSPVRLCPLLAPRLFVVAEKQQNKRHTILQDDIQYTTIYLVADTYLPTYVQQRYIW